MLHRFDNGICMTCMPEVKRNFDPNEPRDPHTGKWGHGTGAVDKALSEVDKALHEDGFDEAGTETGSLTSGDFGFGVADNGDVRLAFHDPGGTLRTVDLDSDEIDGMNSAVKEMADRRTEAEHSDHGARDTFDFQYFGNDDEHKVLLHGDGGMTVVFYAEDKDPWELALEAPFEDDGEDIDDAQDLMDAMDRVAETVDAQNSD